MMPVSSSSSASSSGDEDSMYSSRNNGEKPGSQRKRKLDQENDSSSDEDEEASSDIVESDVAESEADSDDDDPQNVGLSLQERLCQQEAKQATMSTTTALKEQRERRDKARPLAKERLQEFRRGEQQMQQQQQQQASDATKKQQPATTKHKKSKHAPTEVSSRRRHNKTLNERGIGVAIGANRYQPRDPRMSNLSGHLDQDQFEHHYGFLEEAQAKEMADVKQKIKAYKTTGKRGQRVRHKLGVANNNDTIESLQDQLTTLQQSMARQNQQRLERNAKKAVKQKLHAQVSEGRSGVYYPKRGELKKMQMEAKIEEIQKEKGKKGLDQYLAKRRKKAKSRDAKRMRHSEG
jgi:ribosomal RNA-processing protein 36